MHKTLALLGWAELKVFFAAFTLGFDVINHARPEVELLGQCYHLSETTVRTMWEFEDRWLCLLWDHDLAAVIDDE